MASATPALSPPPSPPPPPPPLSNPGIITLNNIVTDGQITTNLYLMFIIGCICFLFFIIFRKGIKLYQTRLYLANVTFKPPTMVLTGHRRIWSWLVPIFTVSDEDMIRSCGLDSLMIVRVATLGVQLFLPMTILACIVLLPTYMTQNNLAEEHARNSSAATSTPFSRATMGNINRASSVFWVPFFYVYIVIIYASWLLRRHYKEYARLRQQYIVQGEVSVNEWHDHFMRQGSRRGAAGKELPAARQQPSGFSAMVQSWTGFGRRDEEDDSGDEEVDRRDSDLSQEDDKPSELRRRSLRRNSSSISRGSSPLLRKLASRRAAHSASSLTSAHTPARTAAADGSGGPHPPLPQPSPSAAPVAAATPGKPPLPPGVDGGSRTAAAGSPTAVGTAAHAAAAAAGPTTPAAADAARQDGGGGGAAGEASTPGRRDTGSQAGGPHAPSNYLEQVFQRAESLVRRNRPPPGVQPAASGRSDTVSLSPDTAPSLVRMDESEAATSDVSSILQQQWAGTSRYETSEDHELTPDSGVVVYKWWQGHRDPHGNLLSGKPNVLARKVVNTNDKGEVVGVMAQQYVVLVEGVPDPAEQKGWRHSEVGRLVSKALRRKNRAASKQGKAAREDSTVKTTDVPTATADSASRLQSSAAGSHVVIDVNGNDLNGSTAPDGGHSNGPANGQTSSSGARPRNVTDNAEADAAVKELPTDGKAAPSSPEGAMTRQEVVHELFKYLFPDTFQLALPVLQHKEVDQLLYKWDLAAKQLEIAEAAFEASELTTRPMAYVGGCCCCGRTKVDAINHWAQQVRELEAAVGKARQRALRSQPTESFFVFFNNQASAATAAQVTLQSEDGRQFRVSQAPGPEEVNWPTLWETFGKRTIRAFLTAIPIAAMIIFPIGIFAGSISQLTLLLCGSPGSNAATGVKWGWYCSGNNYIRKLITGVVPPLILTFWQGIVVPRWFYYWCQAERRATSFTQLDQRILNIFYWWSVFSVFLGAMLGGSVFSQFRVALEDPSKIASIIGTALPTSSNFFINYVIVQALAIQPFRFMFPHMGIFPWVFRACGLCKPPTKRVEIDRLWPHSARGSKEIAFMILVFVIGLAYAAASPLILPVVLLYCLISWAFWRYAVLYFFERCYESGGRLFERVFSQLVFSLFIFEAFTAAVFIANSAWAQGSIMLITLTIYLYQFHKHCVAQFGNTKYVPLESATAAPRAAVDPAMYIPPALRHGCAAWYPEVGKAWEAWNASVYTV